MIISPDTENERLNNGTYLFTFDHHLAATRIAYDKFFKELDANNHFDEYDEVFVMMGLPGSGKSTWAAQHDNERTLIWDSTNLDAWRRIPILSAVRLSNFHVQLVFTDTSYIECCARQDNRPPNRAVPTSTIISMNRRLVRPNKDAEDLDKVIIVKE